MGINGFYTHIVKNHPHIISKFKNFKQHASFVGNRWTNVNLYLDSNSIIYDIYNSHKSNFINKTIENIENNIIQLVINKIEEYIRNIGPTNTVMIAFDGVAPMAKLDQQRTRRYKSHFLNKLTDENNADYNYENNNREHEQKLSNQPWDTTSITPGTAFMSLLNKKIYNYFFESELKYGVNKIIISGSNLVGEGEHKIFDFIRHNQKLHEQSLTIIYGLDSDLIMLAMCHLNICGNIYLFRESPSFIHLIDNTLEPNEEYVLNISVFSAAILSIMNECDTDECSKTKMYDYIILCFLLGNDFLPRFPALNIRTGGIDKLIDAYKSTMGTDPNGCLFNGEGIEWNNLRKIIKYLAEKEHEYLLNDHNSRDKSENRSHIKLQSIEELTNIIPSYAREDEHYINPSKKYWKHRYYRLLFGLIVDEKKEKRISQLNSILTNYLRGIEWTAKYYIHGCPDWKWTYGYNYPPLLEDIADIVPYFSTELISPNANEPVIPLIQLCYVLPRTSLYLVPEKLYKPLIETGWYKNEYDLSWAYCKFLWEAHVNMNSINMNELENIVLLQPK